MNRAFAGNFHELLSLFICQWTCEVNIAFDAIKHAVPGFAIGAIRRVNFGVPQADGNVFERPRFAAGISPKRHRSARAQRREKQVVGRRPGVRAAGRCRFVRMETVLTRLNLLRETGSAAANEHTSIVIFHLCILLLHADACWLRCKNASSSALI